MPGASNEKQIHISTMGLDGRTCTRGTARTFFAAATVQSVLVLVLLLVLVDVRHLIVPVNR